MVTERALVIQLNRSDDVVIACQDLAAGTVLDEFGLTVRDAVPAGHKVAIRNIASGQPVRRYNQIIGFASRPIWTGEHVHVQNLKVQTFERDYAFSTDAKPTSYVHPGATFSGIVRPDGRVATRNYLGVLTTVNCSATVAKRISETFTGDALKEYPNVDGVVAITHTTGCGMDINGEGMEVLRRTLSGYARHVNFCGILMIGLGLRGQSGGRPVFHSEPSARTASVVDDDPGIGRHGRRNKAWRRTNSGDAADCGPNHASDRVCWPFDRRSAMRRFGQLFRDYGEPRAWRGGRSARQPWRYRDFV